MGIHIGKLIESRLEQIRMKKSEFANRINRARQNVNDILNRKSIDTDLLLSISKALNYDFFQHYISELNSENTISEPPSENVILKEQLVSYERQQNEFQTQLAVARKEVELQSQIIFLLKTQLATYQENKTPGDPQ